MSQNSQSLQALFQEAQDEGVLSPGSMQVLSMVDLGTTIQAGLGVNVNQVMASEVILLGLLVDNTGSIAGLEDSVIQGQNECIDAFNQAKQAGDILLETRYYDRVPFPFNLLENAGRLDVRNYQAELGYTPLYDGTLELLAATTAKAQQFAGNGVPIRAMNLIITDGLDNGSKADARDVATLVGDMLRSERHLVAAMGIGDQSVFRPIFLDMGIPDKWIFTPGKTASEIRRIFRLVSQSMIRASQSANFGQAAAGGFGI